MSALTRDEALEVIANHEWQPFVTCSGDPFNKVKCPSCGAQFRKASKRRSHRPGCNWQKLVILVGYALAMTGKTE